MRVAGLLLSALALAACAGRIDQRGRVQLVVYRDGPTARLFAALCCRRARCVGGGAHLPAASNARDPVSFDS
jgi:hypothetical protein